MTKVSLDHAAVQISGSGGTDRLDQVFSRPCLSARFYFRFRVRVRRSHFLCARSSRKEAAQRGLGGRLNTKRTTTGDPKFAAPCSFKQVGSVARLFCSPCPSAPLGRNPAAVRLEVIQEFVTCMSQGPMTRRTQLCRRTDYHPKPFGCTRRLLITLACRGPSWPGR
jgi:hypothetical protein